MADSSSHVFLQKREYIGLPTTYADQRKGVPIFGRAADWRIDRQAMSLAELPQSSVEGRARRGRIVVCRVNEEYRPELPALWEERQTCFRDSRHVTVIRSATTAQHVQVRQLTLKLSVLRTERHGVAHVELA